MTETQISILKQKIIVIQNLLQVSVERDNQKKLKQELKKIKQELNEVMECQGTLKK